MFRSFSRMAFGAIRKDRRPGAGALRAVRKATFGQCSLVIGLAGGFTGPAHAQEKPAAVADGTRPGDPGKNSEVVHWKVDAEEARTIIRSLQQENEKLLQEKLDLEKRITTLRASLILAQTEMDRLRAEKDSGGLGKPVTLVGDAGPSLYEGQVVDVNLELQLVIVNLGRNQGIQHGMTFTRLRNGVPQGHVRVLDVRNDISGAVIEESLDGDVPRKGDRLFLRKETE